MIFFSFLNQQLLSVNQIMLSVLNRRNESLRKRVCVCMLNCMYMCIQIKSDIKLHYIIMYRIYEVDAYEMM